MKPEARWKHSPSNLEDLEAGVWWARILELLRPGSASERPEMEGIRRRSCHITSYQRYESHGVRLRFYTRHQCLCLSLLDCSPGKFGSQCTEKMRLEIAVKSEWKRIWNESRVAKNNLDFVWFCGMQMLKSWVTRVTSFGTSRIFKVSSWPCFCHPWKISLRTPTTSIARIWTRHWNPGSIGIQESLCPIIWLRWCWEINGDDGVESTMVYQVWGMFLLKMFVSARSYTHNLLGGFVGYVVGWSSIFVCRFDHLSEWIRSRERDLKHIARRCLHPNLQWTERGQIKPAF